MIRFESGRDRVWESTRGSGNHTIPVGHVEGRTRHFRWESTLDPSAHERFVGVLISSTLFSSFAFLWFRSVVWFSGFSIRRPFTCFPLFSVRLVWLIFIEMIKNNNFLDNFHRFGYVRYYYFSNKISFMRVVVSFFFCILCRNWTIIYIIINFITFLFSWSLFVASNLIVSLVSLLDIVWFSFFSIVWNSFFSGSYFVFFYFYEQIRFFLS